MSDVEALKKEWDELTAVYLTAPIQDAAVLTRLNEVDTKLRELGLFPPKPPRKPA